MHYVYTLQDKSKNFSVDILYQISGVSVETVRRNSKTTTINGHAVKVAALSDIIASKKAAGRDKDQAVLPILIKTQNEQAKSAQNDQTGWSR